MVSQVSDGSSYACYLYGDDSMKTKYAKVGDKVRVVIPKMFIRCGYPLTGQIVYEKYTEEIARAVSACDIALQQAFNTPIEVDGITLAGSSFSSGYASRLLEKAAISYKMEQLNWGGSSREVYQKEYPELRDVELTVVDKRRVQTGTRHDGYYRYSYYGDGDYGPPYLEIEKTYVVYKVDDSDLFRFQIPETEILAENCELIGTKTEAKVMAVAG